MLGSDPGNTEHDTQVRPLIGLTHEQAKLAWERAVEKAGGRKITARIVQSAVKELQLRGAETPVNQPPHPSKVAQRAIIDGAIGELVSHHSTLRGRVVPAPAP